MSTDKWTLEEVCEKGSSSLMQKNLKLGTGAFPIYGASGLLGFVDFYHRQEEYIGIVKDGAGVGRAMLLPAQSSCIGTMQYLIPNQNVTAHYLYYAIQNMNLAKYNTGATIPHIYFRDYKRESIPKRSIQEQEIISEKIDKVENIIKIKREQLSHLDDLVKSQFIEMFGNETNHVPLSHYISALEAGKSLAGKEDNVNKVLKTGAVSYDCFDETQVKNLPLDYMPLIEHRVNDGDILVSRMNTSELVGAAAYVWRAPSNTYIPDRLWRVKCRDCNPVFLWQLLIQPLTKRRIRQIASGTSGSMKNISKQDFLGINVICVGKDKQNQFAAFVEQTDKSKFRIKQNLEKLEILYKSLLQEYFG